MSDQKATPIQPLNMQDLRVVLSDVIHGLREGTTTGQQAQAITNAAGKIIATVKLEADLLRMTGRHNEAVHLLDAGDKAA